MRRGTLLVGARRTPARRRKETALGDAFDLAGQGMGVLLLHGFTGTPWEVRPIADALHACGFACHGPLLPGHGTTPADLSRTGWRDWVAAAERATDALLALHPAVALVGMSMGALLALDVAARRQHEGRLRGVVTLACALRFTPLTARALWLADLLGERLPHAYIPKWGGADVLDPAARRDSPAYRTQPLRAAREIAAGQRAVRAALPGLRLPLLAVHGLHDQTTPLGASLELLARVGSRDASLLVVPRSGHLVGVDHDRAEVARQVCQFVRRLAADARGA